MVKIDVGEKRLADEPIQLCFKPALTGSLNHFQRLVQQGQPFRGSAYSSVRESNCGSPIGE